MEIFLYKVSSQRIHLGQIGLIENTLRTPRYAIRKFQNPKNSIRTLKKIENLMINSKQQKIENKQSGNIRIEELETKFNQFAELTERIFLQKISMNDPMDVEQQTPTTYIPYGKLRDADIASDQDTKKEQKIRENQWETYLESTAIKKVNSTGKKYSKQTKKLPISNRQLTPSMKMSGFDVQEEIKKSKIKIIKTHETEDQANLKCLLILNLELKSGQPNNGRPTIINYYNQITVIKNHQIKKNKKMF